MENNYYKLFKKINNEYLNKHKYKIFLEKVLKYLPIFNSIIALLALIISIIALFK